MYMYKHVGVTGLFLYSTITLFAVDIFYHLLGFILFKTLISVNNYLSAIENLNQSFLKIFSDCN